jgi:hypothetical protein
MTVPNTKSQSSNKGSLINSYILSAIDGSNPPGPISLTEYAPNGPEMREDKPAKQIVGENFKWLNRRRFSI